MDDDEKAIEIVELQKRCIELSIRCNDLAIEANHAMMNDARLRKSQDEWWRANRKRHAWREYYAAALSCHTTDEECERCADAAIEAEERKFGAIG